MSKKSSTSSQNQKPVELIGIIPRSIIRTLERFRLQFFPISKSLILREFEISRYQLLVSVQCLAGLIFIPFGVTFLAKTFLFSPLTEYLWNTQNETIFLNSYFEKKALAELQGFEEQLYFDYFVSPSTYENPLWASYQTETKAPKLGSFSNPDFPDILTSEIQKKTLELVITYNQKSIESVINLLSDFLSLATFVLLVLGFKPQVIILKSFLLESLYNLSDTQKSISLIFLTDLVVGFHSAPGWELVLELLLNRFGSPKDEHFILVGVATLPVLIDTVFKYWVFRYLNKISPATVATYHAMIE